MSSRKMLGMVAALGLALLLGACDTNTGGIGAVTIVNGSGNVKNESRNVSGFNAVTLAGQGNLDIRVADNESLNIEAEDNILPVLTSDVSGNRLTIGTKNNTNIRPTRPIRYTLTVKDLKDITLSGSGDVTIGAIKPDSFSVTISGSGSISIDDLETGHLDVDISGSGNLKILSGNATDQAIKIPGSGSYQASKLQSKTANAGISGSGNVTIRVSDKLDATISGSGSISYYGNPQVNKKISGSGSITKAGD